MVEMLLLAPKACVENVGDALIGELEALSVSVEDADADTAAEQALFGEPGMPAPRTGWQRSVLRALMIAACCAEVLTLWHTLRRFMVGLDGSITLQHAAWEPPLNPFVLLAVNAAAIAWLGTVALGSGDDVPEDIDDVVGRSGVVV